MNGKYQIKVVQDLSLISKEDWDNLNEESFIFQSYGWHMALNQSGSVGDDRGQWPYYLCLFDDDKLCGIMPCFIKNNSYGEYIFDWQWANHFEMNGINYYPKLVAYTPYTPIIGPKILTKKDNNYSQKIRALSDGFKSLSKKLNCFSCSILYTTKEETEAIKDSIFSDLIVRTNYQFNFINHQYDSFEDLLSGYKKSKRKNIRKERQFLSNNNELEIIQIPIDEIPNSALNFYQFYQNTIEKKYAYPYLTKSFFEIIFSEFKESTLLYGAIYQGKTIAQSLSFYNENEVFGRYWGCQNSLPGLHFELCYYQTIEYAIKNKLKRVQAGAQGQHKIPRGFLPEEINSFHYFHHEQVNRSIQKYIEEENSENQKQRNQFMNLSPFKSNP